MANPEHDDSTPEEGLYASQAVNDAHRSRLRKQVAGVAGLAVVVGGAVFLAVGQMSDEPTAISETGALEPLPAATSPSPAEPLPAEPTSTEPVVSSAVPQLVAPTPSTSLTVDQRIAAARAAMAKDGVSIKRPVAQAASQLTAADVTVTNAASPGGGGTIKVASARGDLTNFEEMSWAADAGKVVGSARCTQNFRFANSGPPRIRPTLLLCWRTSATKSVYTVAVSPKGRPSTATSVAAIDAQWAKLG